MRRILMAGAVALASMVLFASCNKDPHEKEDQNPLKIEISGITSTSAGAVISFSGEKPSLVRLTAAIDASLIDINLEDADAVAKYAYDNGEAVSLPYTAEFTGLQPYVDYVVAAVAFDSQMKVVGSAAATFTTSAPDNAIGDNAGAGSVTDRKL